MPYLHHLRFFIAISMFGNRETLIEAMIRNFSLLWACNILYVSAIEMKIGIIAPIFYELLVFAIFHYMVILILNNIFIMK